jgi:hypothetical protein
MVSTASSLYQGTHHECGFVTTSFTKPYSPTADPAHQRGAPAARAQARTSAVLGSRAAAA